MSIEIGSRWVKDDNQVVVVKFNTITCAGTCVIFVLSTQNLRQHILTEADFLEQYKPYEPIYEYRWAYDTGVAICISQDYFTKKEFNSRVAYNLYQHLDFTKRERK